MAVPGNVEFVAYCPSLSGWLILGWFGFGWDAESGPAQATLNFAGRPIVSQPIVCAFDRPDVRKLGTGAVIYIPAQRELKGAAHDLSLTRGGFEFVSNLSGAQSVDALTAITHGRNLLAHASRSEEWSMLISLLERPLFTGQDTLDKFEHPFFLQIDLAFVCPPTGLWLFGWALDPFDSVARMTLRSGGRSALMEPKTWIGVGRQDVVDGFSKKFGGLNPRCGFLAYFPDAYTSGQAPYVEVETVHGELGFKSMASVRSAGIDTIKDLLARIELRYDDLVDGYDRVVGPAIQAINSARLKHEPRFRRIDFGPLVPDPRCSVIVPLYGRIDFMEYQLAFFSRSLGARHEIIYVLDDPARLREIQFLAASCHARFRRPFTVIALDENLGYAPANNIGLRAARGEYVCFLNSDVFPDEPAWLDYMIDTAASDPSIGVVGALLVFEDETIQHDGCNYERLHDLGNWVFCIHPDKGMMSPKIRRVHEVPGVTGACLLMRAELVRELGGFDEGYVIGDFEDADLCEKAKAGGFICVVDERARLYHLERQSQGDQQASWRFNLTLYNAWRFQNRWDHALVPGSASDPR